MSVLNGIRAVSVYNPADGVYVQIRKVSAGTFDFQQADLDLERSPSGGRLGQADASRVSFEFLDDGTAYQQLRTWQDARTRVSLVAAGDGVAIQWYEKDLVDVRPSGLGGVVNGRGDLFRFDMERQGHGRHAIYKAQNLLAYLGWSAGVSEVASGYGVDGSPTVNFDDANREQDITSALVDEGIRADVVFPIGPGIPLRLSTEFTTLHSTTTSARLKIGQRTYAGSTLSEGASEPVTTGRSGVGITTEATLYSLRVYPILIPTGASGSATVSGKLPDLRIGTLDGYAAV